MVDALSEMKLVRYWVGRDGETPGTRLRCGKGGEMNDVKFTLRLAENYDHYFVGVLRIIHGVRENYMKTFYTCS